MLSQADEDSRSPETGLCFISDKNFVLLGALFAYFIPSSVAIVFAVLCRAEVRQLETHLYRGGRARDWSCRTSCGKPPSVDSPLPLTDPRDAEAQRMLNIPYRIVW